MTEPVIGGYAQPEKSRRQHYFIRHQAAPQPYGVISLCNLWALESAASLSAEPLDHPRLCSGCHQQLNLEEVA